MPARKPAKTTTAGAAYTNVLLEQIRADQRATLEAVTSLGQELRREFAEQFARVNERLSNLEAAVMQNSRDIQRLNAEFANLSEEVRRLRHDFDTRDEKTRIAALEARVTKLERRLKAG